MVKMALVRGRRVLKHGSSFTNGKDGGWIAKRTEKKTWGGGEGEARRQKEDEYDSQKPNSQRESRASGAEPRLTQRPGINLLAKPPNHFLQGPKMPAG